jgi:hypothetical protein
MKLSEHASKLLFALLIVASFSLVGCNEGPFEEASEEVDDAVEEVQDEAEDAADEIEDEVDG